MIAISFIWDSNASTTIVSTIIAPRTANPCRGTVASALRLLIIYEASLTAAASSGYGPEVNTPERHAAA